MNDENSKSENSTKTVRSLTLDGITGPHALFILANMVGVGISLYLTKHYFDSHFPTRFGQASSACDINSFFNCDAATFSPFSAIGGVPISFLGLLVCLIFLAGSLFPSPKLEKTNKFISLINAFGCVVLLVYSLIALGSLCPMCSVYYLVSFIGLYLFAKKSEFKFSPDIKTFVVYGVILAIGGGLFLMSTQDSEVKQKKITAQIVKQYYELPRVGDPGQTSPFLIASDLQSFKQMPIRISLFSDFQCPFCARIATQMEKLAKQFKGKIGIQYFFYPLDNTCNSNIQRKLHPFACQAAYLSACRPERFLAIHDEIFEHQEDINSDFIDKIAKREGFQSCLTDNRIKEIVTGHISLGNSFKVQSTPTMIINGVKIEGALPLAQLRGLFFEILKRANQS